MTARRQIGGAVPASSRVRVRRFHERGRYDREALYRVLDAGVFCHIGFIWNGSPFVIPTFYWRDGAHVYFHGSNASRMLKAIEGCEICLSVTHLDGLILTRSAFHYSANYRSAMIIGRPQLVSDPQARLIQLRNLTESLYPGRWETLRPVKPKELKATRILSLAIDEFSTKIREGPSSEDKDDLEWPVWAGVIPLCLRPGDHQPDPRSTSSNLEPPHLAKFKPQGDRASVESLGPMG